MNGHGGTDAVASVGGEASLTAPASSPRTLTLIVRSRGEDHAVLYSECDAAFVHAHRWHILKSPHSTTLYAAHGKHRRTMHRELLGLATGDPLQGDHIDGNGLNNTRGNLRVATSFQQAHNKKTHRDTESGYKGVRRHGRGWRARIIANGVLLLIGIYPTKEDAARAYNAKAIELHGPFARLNVIPEHSASARLNGMTGAQA